MGTAVCQALCRQPWGKVGRGVDTDLMSPWPQLAAWSCGSQPWLPITVTCWGWGGGTSGQGAGPREGLPCSLESLVLSSFHLVQRGRPPGPQACLQGQALGVQRKGIVGDFDPDSHWGMQPPAAWTLTPAFGPLRDGHTGVVRVLLEGPRGWGCT